MVVSVVQRRTLALAIAVGLSFALLQPESEPALGDSAAVDSCDSVGTPAVDEAAAVALAVSCRVAVEVDSAGTPDTRVFAEPDGRMRMSSYVEPFRARTDSGEWAPIDTTLGMDPSGRIVPVNTVFPVSLSAGGNPTLVTGENSGSRFSLSWPHDLPEPQLTGDTATYPEVMPDVDLTVTVTPGGFSHALTVKTPEAAAAPRLAEIRFGLHTDGVVPKRSQTGGIDLLDATGELLWTTPTPQMWDTPPMIADGEVTQRRVAEVGVSVSDDALILRPDLDLFEGAAYPVVIDPLWNGGGLRNGEWTTLWSKYPSSSFWKRSDTGGNTGTFGAAKVGRVCDVDNNGDCLTSTYVVRSLFRMNTEGVQGRQISSATFKILQKHAWQCSPKTKARVWRTSLVKSSHTWNNQPTWTSETATSHGYANYRSGCGTQGLIEFDVTPMVVKSAASDWKSITLGMKAIDESTTSQWKRYDHSTAKIDIYYNSIPGTPSGLTANGTACISDWSDERVWLDQARPELAGKVTDADGTVKSRIQITAIDPGAEQHHIVYDHISPDLTSGATYRWRPPENLESDRHYWWRMQSTDGQADSAWTGWCYLRVDVSPPDAAEVARLGDPPLAGDTVELEFSGPSADTTGFVYGLNTDVPDRSAPAVAGTATVSWPNLPQGPNVVYVWTKDRAGNLGARTALEVFGGRVLEPQPQGVWRFHGDTLDDSGHDHDVTGSPTYTTDQAGRPEAALELDGTDCLTTTDAVLRTDGPFTVAGWVRLDDASTDKTVLSQSGDQRGAFELHYRADGDAWAISVPGVDAWSPELDQWSIAAGPSGVTVGQWTHLVALVDPVAGMTRLYVNGELAGEAAVPFATWRSHGPLMIGCVGGQEHDLTWNRLDGAIGAVSVWHGLMSQEHITASAAELPLGLTGSWQLRPESPGTDASRHGRDLTMPNPAAYEADSTGRSDSAWSATGQVCATTQAPVLRTDDSFTVATWAKLDSTEADAVLLSQDGPQAAPFGLGFDADSGGWALWLSASDVAGEVPSLVSGPVQLGEWTHLAAVYNAAAGSARLYVNGEPAADANVERPFPSTGPFRVGCELAAGAQDSHWPGAISALATWRGAANASQIEWVHGGNPSVRELSMWALEGDGSDSWGSSGMNLVGDYEWVEDRVGWPGSALGLRMDGTGYGHTDESVVDAADSFTVSAWAKLDDVGGDQTVVAQTGEVQTAFALVYDSTLERWAFRMSSGDVAEPEWSQVASQTAPVVDRWVHLTATFDRAASTITLYVDGVSQGESAAPAIAWYSTGPVLLGASGNSGGEIWDLLTGAVDDVRMWRGVVHPDRIRDLAVA